MIQVILSTLLMIRYFVALWNSGTLATLVSKSAISLPDGPLKTSACAATTGVGRTRASNIVARDLPPPAFPEPDALPPGFGLRRSCGALGGGARSPAAAINEGGVITGLGAKSGRSTAWILYPKVQD